ncbi:MAG: hypothetical protein Q9195_005208 [Heterodermia aff. obscurata]
MTAAVEKLELSPKVYRNPGEIQTDSFPEPGARETSCHEIREGLKPPVQDFIDNSLYLSSGLRTLVICSRQKSSTGVGNSNDLNENYTAQWTDLHKGKRRHHKTTCTQVFVRHPSSNKSMSFQVRPEYTIASIKALVRRKIMTPNANFVLEYSNRLLCTLDRSLRGFNVPHNATLTCVSFRPNSSSSPFPLSNRVTIYIRFLSNDEWRVRLEKDDTILVVKEYIAQRLKNDISSKHIRLIFAGNILENGKPMSEYQIGHESRLYVVFAKAVKNKVRQYSGIYAEPAPAAREGKEPNSRAKTPESTREDAESRDQAPRDEDQGPEAKDMESQLDDQEVGSKSKETGLDT